MTYDHHAERAPLRRRGDVDAEPGALDFAVKLWTERDAEVVP